VAADLTAQGNFPTMAADEAPDGASLTYTHLPSLPHWKKIK